MSEDWRGLPDRIRKILDRAGYKPSWLSYIPDVPERYDNWAWNISGWRGMGPKAVAEVRSRWPYIPYHGASDPNGIAYGLCGPSTSEELAAR